jgi:hypothetical protein
MFLAQYSALAILRPNPYVRPTLKRFDFCLSAMEGCPRRARLVSRDQYDCYRRRIGHEDQSEQLERVPIHQIRLGGPMVMFDIQLVSYGLQGGNANVVLQKVRPPGHDFGMVNVQFKLKPAPTVGTPDAAIAAGIRAEAKQLLLDAAAAL